MAKGSGRVNGLAFDEDGGGLDGPARQLGHHAFRRRWGLRSGAGPAREFGKYGIFSEFFKEIIRLPLRGGQTACTLTRNRLCAQRSLPLLRAANKILRRLSGLAPPRARPAPPAIQVLLRPFMQ